MKANAGVLLLHAGLLSLVAAQTPVFTAKDPDSYIQGSATSDVTGSDIFINTNDGLEVTFGPDVSKKLLELDCTDYKSSDCRQKTAEAMGGGSSEGLQKRMVASYLELSRPYVTRILEILWTWSSGFKNLDDPSRYHVVTISIPHDQADEVSDWGSSDGTFEFAPEGGDSTTVALDTDQPKPDNVPSISKEDNGDIKISMPGMKAEIEAQWSKAICAREEKRSLQKRWVPRCLAQLVEGILRDAQVDGNLAAMQYVGPGFFPKPKNQLLIETFGEVEEYSEKLVMFKGLDAEARGSLTEFATWMTFADHVGKISIAEDGTMVIPKKFLDEQPSQSEDEDEEEGECWEEYSIQQPFCSLCGGDKLGKTSGNGECKGVEGLYQGCPCFVDDDEEDNAYPIAEIDSRLSALDELMIGGTEEEEEQTMEQTCFKSDDSVRKDTSKWRWVGRDVAARRIEEFCSLDFKDDAATREYTDGDDGRDSLKISVSYKGIDPPSRDTCIFNLRDKILDGCDHDDRLNQFNLKWGGRRTESPSGLEFTLQPIHERVATKSPNWECNVWKTREDKNTKGKDGKDLPELVDDKMMKEMCVHEAWYRGWTDINCGGSYNIDMNGSRGYANTQDCWRYNYACMSDAIQNKNAVVMTGTHWAGSAGHTKNYLGIRCWIGFDDY